MKYEKKVLGCNIAQSLKEFNDFNSKSKTIYYANRRMKNPFYKVFLHCPRTLRKLCERHDKGKYVYCRRGKTPAA